MILLVSCPDPREGLGTSLRYAPKFIFFARSGREISHKKVWVIESLGAYRIPDEPIDDLAISCRYGI